MQAPPFLPDEFGEWVAATLSTLAVIGVIFRSGQLRQKYDSQLVRFEDKITALKDDMDVHFKDQGERIGSVEAGCAASRGELDARTAREAAMNMEANSNTRELERLSGTVTGLSRGLRRLEREVGRKDAEIRERIVRLETQQQEKQ